MSQCKSCKNSYLINNNWLETRICEISVRDRNPSLRTLGEEGKCPFYKKEGKK